MSTSTSQPTTKPNKITENITGCEAVVRCLIAEGVELMYGYPGGAIMPVYDELYKYADQIQHVLVRHEQGATHAAQGFARVTGKTGVCIATSGPGATNLVTGIADAMIDSTPMVCITGQVPKHLLGSDAFQETDVMGITMPVTKWSYQITDASEIQMSLPKRFTLPTPADLVRSLSTLLKTPSSASSTIRTKNARTSKATSTDRCSTLPLWPKLLN